MIAGYNIHPATKRDLPTISSWRCRPHVTRWWGDASLEPEWIKLLEPRIAMWIVEADARPFAFIQDYDVHGWSPHHFDPLPPGSRGLDAYIGEPEMLFGGHGSRFLRQHSDHLLSQGSPALGIDPHPDNTPAPRAFQKAGFSVPGGPVQTRWSYALLMDRFSQAR